MKSLAKPFKNISLLTVALTLALSANFAYGQWSNPPGNPPGSNTPAPINTGSSNQTKSGNLTVDQLRSNGKVFAVEYCNETGTYCFTPSAQAAAPTPAPSPTNENCSVGGVSVAHGSSRTFYSRTSTSGSCSTYDQVRSCNDGVMSGSGSYRYSSCSVSSPAPAPSPTYENCSAGGVSVAHGSSRTFYSRATADGSCSAYAQTRSCNDGALTGSGSYQNSSCTVTTPPAGCTNPTADHNEVVTETEQVMFTETTTTKRCSDGSYTVISTDTRNTLDLSGFNYSPDYGSAINVGPMPGLADWDGTVGIDIFGCADDPYQYLCL